MTPVSGSKKMRVVFGGIFAVVLTASVGTAYAYYAHVPLPSVIASHLQLATAATYQTPQEEDVHVRFMMEAFDSITEHFWIKSGDFGRFNSPELPQLFELAVQKEGAAVSLATSTRSGLAEMLADALKVAGTTEAKRQFATQTLQIVLYNLQPIGRDQLLSQQQEKEMRNIVANVNPDKDLYRDIGVEKGASEAQIQQAYEAKSAELKKQDTPEAKAELEKITYAHEVLSDSVHKQLYDTQQVEPSVFGHILGSTLYVYISKVTPTSLGEFALVVSNASTTPGLESMILDLRGNIGGALDFAPAFLGFFIGQGQYAFDLYHQGDQDVVRTTQPQFPELARYKDIAVMADDQSQSTAELTTAILKRARIAHVVGIKTRGWGTIEDTFPLKTEIDPDTKYALLLVQRLTLRDDQQPIEQNGVVPNVDVSVPGWQSHLADYFTSSSLRKAIVQAAAKPPLTY